MQARLPKIVRPEDLGMDDLVASMRRSRERLAEMLREGGGVLFRGFGFLDTTGLERFIEATSGQAMDYTDRAARRTRIEGRVYTATDYPPAQEIFLHNESAYAARWPLKLFLHCRQPAARGGHTPLADTRRVLGRIDRSIRDSFAAKGVMYVRNFGNGVFSPTWQEAFQTDDRPAMESYCRASGIEFEWVRGEHLRTRQVRPAIAKHPHTGEAVWFNHAVTLHVSTLAPRVRKRIEHLFAPEDLPANAYLGDGSPIPSAALEQVRDAYREEATRFDWQRGDVLLLDNMLVAHGREAFSGARDIVVGMSEPTTWEDVEVVRGGG